MGSEQIKIEVISGGSPGEMREGKGKRKAVLVRVVYNRHCEEFLNIYLLMSFLTFYMSKLRTRERVLGVYQFALVDRVR